MIRCRYIKKYLGYDYSLYNHGKDGVKAKRNRRIGNHFIRRKQERETLKEIKEVENHEDQI